MIHINLSGDECEFQKETLSFLELKFENVPLKNNKDQYHIPVKKFHHSFMAVSYEVVRAFKSDLSFM